MQYMKLRGRKEETDIFSGNGEETAIPTITHGGIRKADGFLGTEKAPRAAGGTDSLLYGLAYRGGLRSDLAGHQP